MSRDVTLVHTRTFPAGVKRTFDVMLPYSLPELFNRRYAVIPPITEIRDQSATWDTPGQTRTIVLADGGRIREELREVVRGSRFGYHLDRVRGPMKPIVSSVDGLWEFEQAGTGVRITWTWVVHPRGRLGALAMPAFRRMWQGYARQAFENIERVIVQ